MSAALAKKPGVWTEDEDALLALWQSRVGNKWSEVAKHIPGKTGQQCAQRWRHRVNPNISKEKWTEDEDRKLAALVQKYGNSWAEISRCLPGRTDQQCMGRWRRHLDPTIKRDSWTEEEDAQLRELYAEYGSSWSCISKSMSGRTAQQCRARWCQLTNAVRPSRSAASRSKSSSTAKPAGTQAMDPLSLAELHHLQTQANLRRQSTANTAHLLGAIGAPDPAALFAAAAAEGAAVAAAAAAMLVQQSQAAPQARRLSVVGGTDGGSSSWSQEEGESEESPEFTLRRTTARTAGAPGAAPGAPPGAAPAPAAPMAAAAAAAGLALPPAQHHYLQPPAPAPSREQEVPTPAPAAGTPAVQSIVLPDALLPLRLDLPVPAAAGAGAAAGSSPPPAEEDSPALTQNAAPHAAAAAAATADLLSPLRSQPPPALPLFTPSSSGRKRSAASRMAAFGPSLPPLVIPDSAAAATVKSTPKRPTPGSGAAPMSLELRSPNVLSLLQSPMPLNTGGEDLFRSPGFGCMVTPPWAKCGSSGGSKTVAKTGPAAAQAEAEEEEEEDRRQSVARRLDSAPTFSDFADAAAAAAAAAAVAGAAAQQAQQAQQAAASSLQTAPSFEFGALLGSPPKKSKTCSPPEASQATCATAGTPWMAHTGHSSLALAVQQHLLLASTAKAPAAAGDKENGRQQDGMRGGTLTAMKAGAPGGAIGGGAADKEPISSSKVRQQLTALLDSV